MSCKPNFRYVNLLNILMFLVVLAINSSFLNAQEARLEQAMFGELKERFEHARRTEVNFFAPGNYRSAMELYESALADFRAEARLSEIKEKINQATEYLDRAFEAARISKVALEELVRTRERIHEYGYNRYAPEEMAKSERHFQQAILKAEEGDIRSARSESEKAYQQYRRATIKWLIDGVLKETEDELKSMRRTVNPEVYRSSENELENLERQIKRYKREPFDPFQLREEMLPRIKGILEPAYPPFYRNLPDTLLVGEFVLIVETYSDQGQWDFRLKRAVGLSGKAWTSFNCGFFAIPVIQGFIQIKNVFEVVQVVTNPGTQITIEEASVIQPDVQIGQVMELELAVKHGEIQNISAAKQELVERLKLEGVGFRKRGDILVHFDKVTIEPVTGRNNVGRIVQGMAAYPTNPVIPKIIKLSVEGFTALIDTLTLTTNEAKANITLQFPGSIASGNACQPATLNLGETSITPKCEFYVEKLNESFAPFWIGSTNIKLKGKGYVADFSATKSYIGSTPLLTNSWRGLYLLKGQSVPAPSGNVVSNTGYVKGSYSFSHASITSTGFHGTLQLTAPFTFLPVQPFGYKVAFQGGKLQLDKSEITGGSLTSCEITLPRQAAQDAKSAEVTVKASSLTVQKDGDLYGEVTLDEEMFWGELTHAASLTVAYSADVERPRQSGQVRDGYFYLSAHYKTPYFPLDPFAFKNPDLSPSEKQLEALGIQGVTLEMFRTFKIHTPDTPLKKPIVFSAGAIKESWVNIVSQGVHGLFSVHEYPDTRIQLGPTYQSFYVGKVAFSTRLAGVGVEGLQFKIEFVNSAVYDANMNGSIRLQGPSKIDLDFKKMQFTSTAHNAGGQVDLSKPDTLDYWGVELVGKAGFSSAGLVSVKTGQIILTAAGLQEKRHFSKPFYLTWGEMLATGDFGRLFFDYNNVGQTFDGFKFAHSAVRLSTYDTKKPGYLQAGGTAHFDFFGANYLNIHDQKYTDKKNPWNGRLIKLGFDQDKSFSVTDTTIARNWSGKFGSLKFNIQYDAAKQDGFIGNGQIGLNFVLNGTMDGSVVLNSKRICMSINEKDRHDFTLGPMLHFGSMSSIWACGCIENGQLKRFMLGAELEASGNANVLLRSAAYGKIEYMVTPSVSELTVNGNMYVTLLTGGNLEVTGRARFKVDTAQDYVDGDIYGKFNAEGLISGLSAEGQVNWHIGTKGQEGYIALQGKLAVSVLYGGTGGSVEGGFYVGLQAPKSKAWILKHENSRFRLNMNPLPSHLTGVYGYLEYGGSFNIFLFSGGIKYFVGLGGFVFTDKKAANVAEAVALSFVGMPYALGHMGVHIYGKILGGLVSAGGWGDWQVIVGFPPAPFSFEGTLGLEGCVVWFICGSVEIDVGLNSKDGFYLK